MFKSPKLKMNSPLAMLKSVNQFENRVKRCIFTALNEIICWSNVWTGDESINLSASIVE